MPDPEEEQVRDVYAHFGLAVYLAQCLEHGIANALVFADLIPQKADHFPAREQWDEDFDAFMGSKFQATLGRLIEQLREVTQIEPDLEALLKRALQRRNWLAHHYFRERAEALVSQEGRRAMLEELQEAQQLFQKVDAMLFEVVRPIRERFGITDQVLEEWMQRYQAEIMRDG